MPFDSPRVALSMDQHTFPAGASPGLAIREREQRRSHEKHIKRHRPAVLAASSALQNALGIRNTSTWPTPPVPNTGLTHSTMERNGLMLREALSECQQYAVRVNRGSEFRDFLDDTVHDLGERKAKVGGPLNMNHAIRSHDVDAWAFKGETPTRTAEGNTTLAQPFGDKEKDRLFASYGVPPFGAGRVEPQQTGGLADWQVQYLANESQFGGSLPPFRETLTMAMNQREPSMGPQHAVQLSDIFKGAVSEFATEESCFPDPLEMPGSFTAAVCGYPDFQISPLLSLTLKDVVPPMHTPTAQRCILLRHFEVGLDEVEAIITGEVKIPESLYWARMREERLGKLGHKGTGDDELSKELLQKQREQGWGQGKWLLFGVKFQQSTKEQREGTGKWFCFGAPVEAVEKRHLTEQYVEIGGGKDGLGKEIPTHTELFARQSTLFCLGGTACIDLWDGAEDWDNGVFSEVSNAMANVGLRVETLHLAKTPKSASNKSMRPPKLNHRLSSGPEDPGTTMYSDPPTAAMDGPAESQKRKSSIVIEYPRKVFDFTKSVPASPKPS